jgi:hypothetical protein
MSTKKQSAEPKQMTAEELFEQIIKSPDFEALKRKAVYLIESLIQKQEEKPHDYKIKWLHKTKEVEELKTKLAEAKRKAEIAESVLKHTITLEQLIEAERKAFEAGQNSIGYRDEYMSRIDLTWEDYKNRKE